ncbi:MAG: hypothetical protein ABI228_04485 [Burkholderiaceae bacterium]
MTSTDALAAMNKAQEAFDTMAFAAPAMSGQPWSEPLVKYLSMSVLGVLVIAFILCTALLWKRNTDAPEILKIFGILSIIGLSALLLITGFSNEQLTPIVGLFGAIAGYLLGKDSKSDHGRGRDDV